MRFSGHETFAIREGWLHKGLKLLMTHPDRLADDHAADWLGVGRNMAKSIRYWLVATGLAEAQSTRAAQNKSPLVPSVLGKLIYKQDLYFVEPGTWWILHVNLISTQESTASWAWFFNNFGQVRFDRSLCLEHLRLHLQYTNKRLPSVKTLERDIACLLSSYAQVIPEGNEDPEEALNCPFVELGLLTFFRNSGSYQLNQGPKPIPPEILGYTLSRTFWNTHKGAKSIDVTIQEAAMRPGGPGRAFILNNESLFEVAIQVEEQLKGKGIEIAGLAGERVIRFEKKDPLEWLKQYYSTVSFAEPTLVKT